MFFAIGVNLVPCLMAFTFVWMIKKGEVPFGIGLMLITRRDLPLQYIMFMIGYAFLMLVLLGFAAYLDWVAFFPLR